MSETILMHELQSLKNLAGNEPGLVLWERLGEVPLQIAMLQIFHRYKDVIW